jgi:hypothetical protein
LGLTQPLQSIDRQESPAIPIISQPSGQTRLSNAKFLARPPFVEVLRESRRGRRGEWTRSSFAWSWASWWVSFSATSRERWYPAGGVREHGNADCIETHPRDLRAFAAFARSESGFRELPRALHSARPEIGLIQAARAAVSAFINLDKFAFTATWTGFE